MKLKSDSTKEKQRAPRNADGAASGKLAAVVLTDMPAADGEQKPTDTKEKEPAAIERPVPIWSILPHRKPEQKGEEKGDARCPWTGITISVLRDLTRPTRLNGGNPPVSSVIRVRPGGARGRVYFKLRGAGGLLEYLERLATEQRGMQAPMPADTAGAPSTEGRSK